MIDVTNNKNRVIYYTKETNNPRLCDKTVVLGVGSEGTVYQHRLNPQHVVKKSRESLQEEHAMGLSLDHRCVVKMEDLYIQTPSENSDTPVKFQLVMHKIDGTSFQQLEEAEQELSSDEKKKLLLEAKECCHDLFQRRVAWADLHAENVFLTHSGHLMICDLGLWTVQKNPLHLSMQLLEGTIGITSTILGTQVPRNPCHLCQIFTPLTADSNSPSRPKPQARFCGNTHGGLLKKIRIKFQKCTDDAARLSLIDAYFDGVIARL